MRFVEFVLCCFWIFLEGLPTCLSTGNTGNCFHQDGDFDGPTGLWQEFPLTQQVSSGFGKAGKSSHRLHTFS